MTDLEAATLLAIVREALVRGGIVPTCRELAQILHLEQTHSGPAPESLAKLVNDRLLKLNREHRFLYKKRTNHRLGRAWHLDTDTLVTEPESALYLIALVEACTPPQDKISKALLHQTLITKHGFSSVDVERLYSLANRTGYVVEIGGDIRPGERSHAQLPYLRLRAKDRRNS